ncbi:MAG TPA: hypothetical protein VGM23_05210 [Armatimonadota bacterium]|jgi:hypothetical protein
MGWLFWTLLIIGIILVLWPFFALVTASIGIFLWILGAILIIGAFIWAIPYWGTPGRRAAASPYGGAAAAEAGGGYGLGGSGTGPGTSTDLRETGRDDMDGRETRDDRGL